MEEFRSDLDPVEFAESQFAEQEIQALQAIDPAEREAAFFRCWTRKEAYLKARGNGPGFPLDQFAVAFAHHEAPAVFVGFR